MLTNGSVLFAMLLQHTCPPPLVTWALPQTHHAHEVAVMGMSLWDAMTSCHRHQAAFQGTGGRGLVAVAQRRPLDPFCQLLLRPCVAPSALVAHRAPGAAS